MIRTGTEQVDTGRALHILKEKFQMETILVDSGETLSNLLIEEGFVDAISLVIAPVISTDLTHRLFKQIELKRPVKLKIKGIKKLKGDKFDLKEFHEQFLGYGNAPVKYIRELMLSTVE